MKNIMILMGRKRSGKDTYFNELEKSINGSVKNVKFARKIKTAALDIFGENFDGDDIKEKRVLIYKDKLDKYVGESVNYIFGNNKKNKNIINDLIKSSFEEYIDKKDNNFYFMSSRDFQQKYGTEFCRNIENDIFINDGINNIFNEDNTTDNYKLYCISDGRFQNEINLVSEACKKNNGNLEIVYILRYIQDGDKYTTVNPDYNTHNSEALNNKIELLSLDALNTNNYNKINDFFNENFKDMNVRVIARKWENEYNPNNPVVEFDLLKIKALNNKKEDIIIKKKVSNNKMKI